MPGSGLAKLGGFSLKIFSPFFRAGKLAFNHGLDLANLLRRGGTGNLVEAADVITDTYRGLKAHAQAGKRTAELAGEIGAIKVADKLGLELLDDFPRRYHGIDTLYMHGDDLVIVEAKGISAGGHATLGQTMHGEQLSRRWIEQQRDLYTKWARAGDTQFKKWADLLTEKIRSGNVKVLLTETTLNTADDVITDVAFHMRNWSDIARDTFIP